MLIADTQISLLSAVARSLPGGSVNVFDRDRRYVYAAGPGLDVVGLTSDALVGRTLLEVFGADGAALVEPHYARAFEGESVSFDIEVAGRTYRLSASPFSNADQIIVLAQDVTVERDHQREHQQRTAFMATVAHELRQPLAPLRVALSLLLQQNPSGPTHLLARRMAGQVEQLERLTADLSDFARIAHGEVTLQLQPLDLCDVIDEAVQVAAYDIDRRRQTLDWGKPAGVQVNGDRVRLRQVFSNLLVNAAKYTPEEGRIGVGVSVAGQQAEVRVRDSGVGIDPALLPNIFDVFVQGDPARGGMGIGLSVVRRLVEAHGGQVQATSDGDGRGSEFLVSLPLLLPPPTERPQA